jgi:hypothetical protein
MNIWILQLHVPWLKNSLHIHYTTTTTCWFLSEHVATMWLVNKSMCWYKQLVVDYIYCFNRIYFLLWFVCTSSSSMPWHVVGWGTNLLVFNILSFLFVEFHYCSMVLYFQQLHVISKMWWYSATLNLNNFTFDLEEFQLFATKLISNCRWSLKFCHFISSSKMKIWPWSHKKSSPRTL